MLVKYRCPVKGSIRLPFSFPVPAQTFKFEFETDADGLLTHVSGIASVPDRSMWPAVQSSPAPGVKLHIIVNSPILDTMRDVLRAAEGMLSLLGLQAIELESAEESWFPETADEVRELQLFSYTRSRRLVPVRDWPMVPFELVAEAFMSAHRGRGVETALSFFRKGRADILESRYIEAVFDFLFMVESLYAGGKYKTAQVEAEYLKNKELQLMIGEAVANPGLTANISGNSRITAAFARDYESKTPAEITHHLVALRGFIHHHTSTRPGIWHPDDHMRFGADAYFLEQLCCAVGFHIADPIWFAKQHVGEYQELFKAYATQRETAEHGQHS